MDKWTTKIKVEPMDSAERLAQLEKIDKLREFGVGEEINLPQLVVVGDQSSGKSSLLEGLTGLPFPVASELCTRFATQIVFRRSPTTKESIRVSIIPTTNADDAARKKLGAFTRSMTEFSAETFAKVLDQAAECMGLPHAEDPIENAAKRFSNDVLKVEITGPQQDHLSFVDIPGLFHNPTKYQTSEDRIIIRELIEGYVEDQRTIIMAVMDARNNLANQEVFRIAKAADKEGTRTVGIMTKCDALQKGDEPAAIKIAQNLTEKLTHGWFCVRNRSTTEIMSGVTMEQRHENERKFFETAPWNVLDKQRVGIASLKRFLGRLLSDHVAREFPAIRKEIDNCYKKVQKDLDQLGPPRQTANEQMQYMLKLARAYQQKVESNLAGRYLETGMHPSKLRMHVQKANEDFNTQMHDAGHHYQFQSTATSLEDALKLPPKVVEKVATTLSKYYSEDDDYSEEDDCSEEAQTPPAASGVMYTVPDRIAADNASGNIYLAISELYITSRGTELPGLVNPSVLEVLFARQTVKWVQISQNYVDRVVRLIRSCNQSLFAELSMDEHLKMKVADTVNDGMETSITAARSDLSRILTDEREGPLTTINHYFADNLAAARAERVVAQLRKLGYKDGEKYTMNFKSLTSVAHLSNEASAVHDIHDVLKAYYKVAMKRFNDNVVNQVVQRNLLGPGGPLTVFAPDWVGKLDSDELAAIAGEDFMTSNARKDLTAQLGRLEQARKICSEKSRAKRDGM